MTAAVLTQDILQQNESEDSQSYALQPFQSKFNLPALTLYHPRPALHTSDPFSRPSHTMPSSTNILGLPSLHLAVVALGRSTTVPALVAFLLASTQTLGDVYKKVRFDLDGRSCSAGREKYVC
jgi:hypothetical protein